MSQLSQWYSRIYVALCGTHPNERFWHFQWLSSYVLHRDLKQILPTLQGYVIDLGCGDKPYQAWFKRKFASSSESYVGVDFSDHTKADVTFDLDTRWPLESNKFDGGLCTQVLQYVQNLPLFVSEIGRVMKPGGLLVLTVPFIYNDNPFTRDSWRFTAQGITTLFHEMYEVIEIRRQGGLGSTIGLLFLNWIECQACRTRPTRFLKALLLPFYLPFCSLINVIGWCFDQLDTTDMFYSNLLVLLKKRA